jgi:Caspase recruitment domain
LYYKSFSDFSKFLRCLEITKQSLVVSLLSPSDPCCEEPLSDVMKSRLMRNHAKLVYLIDTEHNLLAELLACDCLSFQQRQYIESAESQVKINRRLLDILRRGSEKDFNKFIDCLKKTGQEHVANVLLNDGVVAHIVATTNVSAREETYIVDRFMAILGRSSSEDRERLIQRVNEFSRDVDLLAVKKENSIGIFYFCRSLAGLQHLDDLYSSGQLKFIFENVFSELLNDSKLVPVESLHWDVRDFTNCMQCLCSSVDLRVFSKLYEMTKCSIECSVSSIHIDQFPSEIQQLILMKSTGQLFVLFNKVTPLAAIYSMATMCGVSMLWWNSLSYRQYNKRVMRRYFQQVCSPFKCHPRRLQSLHADRSVNGLVEFKGKLYVVCVESSAVQVFVSRSPFSRLDNINVQGLTRPIDIVVCNYKSQLYIADGGSQRCIWRMDLMNNKQIDKFITNEWEPYSLSINSSRLLITQRGGDALFLYNDDGSELNHIQLPKYMRAYHAVETTNKTYIVCYYNKYTGSEDVDSVSELDVDGRVVCTFNNQHIDTVKFNMPRYLAIDGNNHVIVADCRNKRVILLKLNLQLKRVLIPTLDEQPTRLCLSESTGLMFINNMNSSNVEIYQVIS